MSKNPKYEYIKEASPFGSLRQIPEMEEPMLVEGLELLNAAKKRQYQEELFRMPLYPLSVQPSNEWIQRKEYECGKDFKLINHPFVAGIGWAIPIEKKDDLVASQNHPQPGSSVATLACTEGNSIEQAAEKLLLEMIRKKPAKLLKFFACCFGIEMKKARVGEMILNQEMDIEGKRYNVQFTGTLTEV